MNKEETIGIRIDAELRRKLETMAKKADRTLSDFIRHELKKLAEKA